MYFRLLHILLACCLLMNTTGLSVYVHFCQGKFAGIRFLGNDDACSSTKEKSCHAPKTKNDCCKDEKLKFEAQDYDAIKITPQTLTWETNLAHEPLTFVAFEQVFLPFVAKQITPHNYYYPPPQQRDICVLLQTFRC